MKKKTFGFFMGIAAMLCFAGCGVSDKAVEADNVMEETGETEDMTQDDVAEEVVFSSQASDEVQESAADILERKINEFSVSIPFGDSIETLGADNIKEWITVTDDSISAVDEEAVREYVNSLSKKYDTFGINRSFKTHEGNTVTVAGGDFGWWMDRGTTTKELAERVKNLESGEFTPVYFGTGLGYGNSENDIGNTYVEIDLDAQHLYVYQNGSAVTESDFVSGGLLKGNGTPTGTYGITYKERDATLVGENYSSAVSYWMPFNGNVGMHDASWRSSFGGTIYYMSGSHGCINLPKDKAGEIYGIVEKGEPVVVYGTVTKEQAIANLSDEEKLVAMQKGYIPMSDEVALMLLQQQALAVQAAGQAAEAGQAADPNAAPDPNAAADPNAGAEGAQ